jgi:hypothetical protein
MVQLVAMAGSGLRPTCRWEVCGLQLGTTLWKSQKSVGGNRTIAQWMGLAIATDTASLLAGPILREKDASTVDGSACILPNLEI